MQFSWMKNRGIFCGTVCRNLFESPVAFRVLDAWHENIVYQAKESSKGIHSLIDANTGLVPGSINEATRRVMSAPFRWENGHMGRWAADVPFCPPISSISWQRYNRRYDDDFEVCENKPRRKEMQLNSMVHPWLLAIAHDSSRLDRAYYVLSAKHASVLPPRSVHQQSVSMQPSTGQERRYLHKSLPHG